MRSTLVLAMAVRAMAVRAMAVRAITVRAITVRAITVRAITVLAMSALALAVVPVPASAAPAYPLSHADNDRLSNAVIKRLAARFDKDIRQHGAEGLWADIQACYSRAVAMPNKRREIGQCLMLDEGGKVLDDGRVLIAAKSGSTVPNKDWCRTAVFDERIKKYSEIGFSDPYGSTPFLNKNMNNFLDAIKKLH